MAASPSTEAYPQRGLEVTRLGTFTDAAFAFAAALLAISIDDVPGTYEELIRALKDAPAFAGSLALLLLYWRAHQTWGKRFGLEDLGSVLLTFGLVMVVMIYVYPLKIMIGAGFHFLSGGWFPSYFRLENLDQFRGLVTIYGVGFVTINVLVAALYFNAWRQRDALRMSPPESFDCASEAVAWLIVGSFGLVSIVMAWTLPDAHVPWAAMFYIVLALVGPVISMVQVRLAHRRFADAD